MNFFQRLFGSKEEKPEEKKKEEEAKDFDVLKYDGVKALQMGQLDYAIKCFQHALQIQDDMEIHDYLSRALIHSSRLTEAYNELQKLAEAQPDNQQIFIRKAHVAFMMEDYVAMSDDCEKALLIDKENPEVSLLYARAMKGQGDMVNTIAMTTKAISLNENYGDAHLLRGQTLLEMGDTQGAGEDADWLVEKAPDNEDVLLFKAHVEHAKGNDDDAINVYGKVIDANPFCLAAYKERGALLLAKGDKDGAAADAAKVLEINPKETADVSGEYSAEGIEAKTKAAYRDNPLGLG